MSAVRHALQSLYAGAHNAVPRAVHQPIGCAALFAPHKKGTVFGCASQCGSTCPETRLYLVPEILGLTTAYGGSIG